MKRIINVALAGFAAAALAVSLGAIGPAFAQMKEKEKTVNVGGAPMYPSKNIVQNAVNSKDHTTLVAAVKAGGLVDTLGGLQPSVPRHSHLTKSAALKAFPSLRPELIAGEDTAVADDGDAPAFQALDDALAVLGETEQAPLRFQLALHRACAAAAQLAARRAAAPAPAVALRLKSFPAEFVNGFPVIVTSFGPLVTFATAEVPFPKKAL